jgi:hypothetical protein
MPTPTTTAQQPGGIQGLVSNPNFINLLAGIGTRLDPEGIGGILGVPTQQINQSIAAQRALSSQEAQRKETNALLQRLLAGMTPNGVEGPSSITINPDGFTAKVETPGGGSALLDTGVSAGAPASTTTPAPLSTSTRGSVSSYRPATGSTQLSQIIPFY